MVHPDEELNNIMIFGCYLLDRVGNVWSVEKKDSEKPISKGNVEPYKDFCENNKGLDFILTTGGYVIPTANSVCPCCRHGDVHKKSKLNKVYQKPLALYKQEVFWIL